MMNNMYRSKLTVVPWYSKTNVSKIYVFGMFLHSIPWHGDSLGALVLAGSIIRPSDCRTAKKYYKLLKLNPKSCLIHLVHGTRG